MTAATPDFLKGVWFVAMAGRRLRRGKVVARTLLGEPILFGRRSDGSVFAIRDICPHRGMPLRYGHFDGETVRCAYHGWRFGGDGRCVEIPALVDNDKVNLAKIRCRSYPCAEQQGLIWIYNAEPGHPFDAEPASPPMLPDFGAGAAPRADVRLAYPCAMQHATFGLIDPAHVAFVHGKWWLGKTAKTLRVKEKQFEPLDCGWTTRVHEAPTSSPAYKLLGGEVKTQIRIQLPGLRIERIFGARHQVVNLLAITPIDAQRTQMIQGLWWSMRRLGVLRPLIERIAHSFLSEDGEIAERQREGLAYDPPLMLMPDADAQMQWWLALQSEWQAHRRERRPFRNPLQPTTLRYRS